MFHIVHSYFWQLMEELPVLLAAWGLSQTHGSLIKRKAVSCPDFGVRQPFCDALNSLAKNTHIRTWEDPAWSTH